MRVTLSTFLFSGSCGGSDKSRCCCCCGSVLAPEAVQGASLSLQSVHDVHRCDGFPLGVLAVGHGISDDVLKEDLQDAACFLVDQPGDSLDATSSGQATNRWFSDALDVVSQDFSVTLGTALSQSLSSFASSGHFRFTDMRSQGECGESSAGSRALYYYCGRKRSHWRSHLPDAVICVHLPPKKRAKKGIISTQCVRAHKRAEWGIILTQ